MLLSLEERITERDVRIFTQNFFLLKKANFNNIHALNTLIQSTENMSFRGVLEDILAGVEAGEYMYTTMEYYADVFPYIYINMIKVGELSGSLTQSLQQAVKYLDDTSSRNRKLKSNFNTKLSSIYSNYSFAICRYNLCITFDTRCI